MANEERIQTMQAFMGHFNPAEAERMAQGWTARLEGDHESSEVEHFSARKDPAADERLLQRLSALQDAFADLEIAIEDTVVDGDKVAIHLSVASY